ncbi:hypothetical protein DVW05_15920 [Clostridium botulinum]|uniref:hypothetical protein n=1 Tax=Clostridium sp. ZBS18 TaxID=2949967 RepID=UPI001D7F3AE7|nr:hypothetical protein [Clostridium sp. ZBS18]MBN1056817.1 hypothetical protein [Clostridium botulinum]
MKNNKIRITEFLQWNDRNGCYTDENCDIEGVERMTYEDAVKYFFGVMNEDFYYNITDNIFELTYEDVIRYAKENNLYGKTMCKLEMLFNQENIAETFYRRLLDYD